MIVVRLIDVAVEMTQAVEEHARRAPSSATGSTTRCCTSCARKRLPGSCPAPTSAPVRLRVSFRVKEHAMADGPIIERINELAHEEEELWRRASDGGGLATTDQERLDPIGVELDQCYDLLRQRQARREYGLDPDDAESRPAEVVEKYLQRPPRTGPTSIPACRPVALRRMPRDRWLVVPFAALRHLRGISAAAIRPFAHTKAHTVETGHTIVASFEPNEQWFYDYDTDEYFAGPPPTPPGHHPLDQPTPGPAGRARLMAAPALTAPDQVGPYHLGMGTYAELTRGRVWYEEQERAR